MNKLGLLLLLAAGCTTDESLGHTFFATDAGTTPPAVDAAYTPDANPPHNFVWWAPQLGVAPDQACNPWALTDTAAADPALGASTLTLTAGAGETMAYAQSGADLMSLVPDTLFLGVSVQLIDGEARVLFRYHGWTDGLTISDGSVATDGGAPVTTPTTDTVHNYRLEVDLWTGRVIVKIDETVISTEWALAAGAGAETIELGQLAPGTSAWSGIAHDVHATTDCPLPG